jgi:hypothetical protein
MLNLKLILSLLSMCVLLACGRKDNEPAVSARHAALPLASSSASLTDRWNGKWLGPEGTFLEIAGSGEKYQIVVRNLDGARTFDGIRSGDRITFERDGTRESIRSGSGEETGMKWLTDKSDCLVIKPGEGYCRG